jgi:hypothetical protein
MLEFEIPTSVIVAITVFWYRLVWYIFTNVQEETSALNYESNHTLAIYFLPWKWRHQVPPKSL